MVQLAPYTCDLVGLIDHPPAQFGDKALQGSHACFEVVVHSDVLADLALGRILLADSIELDGGGWVLGQQGALVDRTQAGCV